jgi:hypothetical protein
MPRVASQAAVNGRLPGLLPGREAFVPWDKLRDKDTPVRLAYGYALTIDASQGITSGEHIDALPSGSRATHGFKTYVAESRHREATWMVVNEAAERRQIASRIPLGDWRQIREADVWRNIAANLSRQPAKASAIDFIKHSTGLWRGTVYSVQHGNEPGDRREKAGQYRTNVHRWSARVSMERAPVVRRLLEQAQQLQRQLVERLGPRHRQGRRLGL